VDTLVDLREKPYSRKKEFSKIALMDVLRKAGIDYKWMGNVLGGLTISKEKWIVGCEQLAKMAQNQTIVMMCLEADYRKCHRKEVAEMLALFHKIDNINL